GSALGIAFGVAIAVILVGRRSLPWLRVCLSYFAVGIMLWLVLSFIIPTFIADEIQVRGIKLHDAGRWPMFLEAWAMSFQSFPFGMGPQSWLTHDILNESSGASGQ